MDDNLSQDGDRKPSPWPRILATIAPLIVVVVGAAILLSLPRHQHAPVPPHRTCVTASPAPVPTPSRDAASDGSCSTDR